MLAPAPQSAGLQGEVGPPGWTGRVARIPLRDQQWCRPGRL